MEKNIDLKEPYTFVELLPILTTFSQTIHLCDRAFMDDRLTSVHPDVRECIDRVSSGVKVLIKLLNESAISD